MFGASAFTSSSRIGAIAADMAGSDPGADRLVVAGTPLWGDNGDWRQSQDTTAPLRDQKSYQPCATPILIGGEGVSPIWVWFLRLDHIL